MTRRAARATQAGEGPLSRRPRRDRRILRAKLLQKRCAFISVAKTTNVHATGTRTWIGVARTLLVKLTSSSPSSSSTSPETRHERN